MAIWKKNCIENDDKLTFGRKIFHVVCVYLMLINNNVYTFVSGILLSLSTGIFTTLCLDKEPFSKAWYLYASSMIYTLAGALLFYVATRITAYQNYILSKQIVEREAQHGVIVDFEAKRYIFWICVFGGVSLSLVSGTVLLFINYFV